MRTLFVIGDSISMQYGPYLKSCLAGAWTYDRKRGAEHALQDLDQPVGANGGDSALVLAYLEELQRSGSFQPDLLLLNCGLHDIKTDPHTGAKQVPIAQYRANLERIMGLLRQMRISTVWVRTTPVNDEQHNTRSREFHRFARDVAEYNAIADEVCTAAGAPLLDLFSFTRNLGEDVFCDHVHFTEPVRAQQAAFIAGFLDSGIIGE